MLPGACQVTLYGVFTCAMLSEEYQGKIAQDYLLCNVVWSLSDNIA